VCASSPLVCGVAARSFSGHTILICDAGHRDDGTHVL
jgi:hypothetical protein